MDDITCTINVGDWFNLFTTEWYYENSLEVYLNGKQVLESVNLDLCEGWVEHIKREDGYIVTDGDEILYERSYGEVTLKIRRT